MIGMLCQKCGKNQATTHIKAVANGKLVEYMLCSDCAREMGYGNLLSHFSFGNILESFFDDIHADSERCPACGATFEDITHSGKVGCSKCYEVFYQKLYPTIQRIHGTTVHKGKTPGKSALVVPAQKKEIAVSAVSPIEQKKLQLKNAIAEQRFEDAAKLRDEIRELENNAE